jgi:hypothetical protein
VIIRVRIRRVSTDARLNVDAAAIRSEISREFVTPGQMTAGGIKPRIERALTRIVDSRRVR